MLFISEPGHDGELAAWLVDALGLHLLGVASTYDVTSRLHSPIFFIIISILGRQCSWD